METNRNRLQALWPAAAVSICCAALCGLALGGREAEAQRRRTAEGEGSIKIVTGRQGSVVFIDNVRHGMTGPNGVLELPHVKAGAHKARVRTVGYVDWEGALIVWPGRTRTLTADKAPALADEAVLHYQKGDELRDQAKNEEAVKEYQQAVERRPAMAEARIGMARSLITLQKFDEAEKQLQAVIEKPGARPAEAVTVMANLRRYQGLIDESIEEYKKALVLARGVSPEAHIGLAIALEESMNLAEAIREYRRGIAQDMDTEPILYYLLGSALEKADLKKEAIEAYRGYLRLDREGQYASAVESIIQKLKEEPE